MLEGFTRYSYKDLGGYVSCMAPERVPLGSASQARNCKFLPNSVRPRDGLTLVWTLPDTDQSVRGLGQLILQDASNTYIPLVYGEGGVLFKETIVGSGSLQIVESGLPFNAYPCFTSAYGRTYIGFSDRISGTGAPKQYYNYQGSYTFRGISPAANAVPAVGAEENVLGDCDAGDIRYAVVFFETETGYQTGFTPAAVFAIDVATSEKQLRITDIPVGPAGTIKRWVAFTPVGGSSAGDFFIIETAETLQEANAAYTATVIEDNATTEAVFNFSDLFLQSATNVTSFFNKFQVPNCGGVRFLPSIRRIAYYGDPDAPSAVYMSDPDDPETLFTTGPDGGNTMLVAEEDGERVQSVFEFRHSVYVAKDRSGHSVTVGTSTDNTTPSSWTITELWNEVGPCGPDALDVCDEFVCFASRKGLYKFDGGNGPDWISWEHGQSQGLWAQINWKYGHLINLTIDPETKRIFVSVPMGQSTTCSHVLTCDYSNGFAQPVQANPQNGVLMTIRGRRWSVDDVAANKILRMERPVTWSGNPSEAPDNNAQQQSQLLIASSGADNTVNMFDSSSATDNTQQIAFYYTPAYLNPGGLHTLGGVTLEVRGAGNILLTALGATAPRPLKPMFVDSINSERTIKCRGVSNNWAVQISTQSPGDWCEVGEIAVWIKQKWEVQVEGR